MLNEWQVGRISKLDRDTEPTKSPPLGNRNHPVDSESPCDKRIIDIASCDVDRRQHAHNTAAITMNNGESPFFLG